MAKSRAISSRIRKSETFAKFTYRQRDLWQGIIEVADDQGRLPGQAAFIRSEVWPYDDISIKDVEADLVAIAQAGNIVIYQDGGSKYLQIVNWWMYQTIEWAGKSDFPAPDGWTDRERYHGKGNQIVTLNWDKPGGFIIGSALPRPLPSALPSPLDCNGIKGEGEGEGEDEVATPPTTDEPLFQGNPLSRAFEQASGIVAHSPEKWMTAINAMAGKGATPEDVETTVKELRQKEYTIIGPWSITNAIVNTIGKRRSGNNGKKPQPAFVPSEEFGL